MFVPRIPVMTPAELNDALRTLGPVELHRIAASLVSENAGTGLSRSKLSIGKPITLLMLPSSR